MARFLVTLAVLFLIFYGFRFLRLYIFPMMIRRLFKKYGQRPVQYQRNEPVRKEGEVSITNTTTKSGNTVKPDDGEYVDFEEIKD